MKVLLAIFLFPIVLSFSCKSPEQKNKEHVDSLIQDLKYSRMADSVVASMMSNAFFDTVGVADGPVTVITAKLVTKEYSSYKDIHLVYRNSSKKTISAIRFRWYGENAFGEPADMGLAGHKGFGGGFTDDPMQPGARGSGTWDILSGDGKKVIRAWAYEVAFSDGTKWKSTYKQ
jgi:hypothetical protein